MLDNRAVQILDDFHGFLKTNLIPLSISNLQIPFSVGDLMEAINIAKFTLENKDEFYISKDVIYEEVLYNLNENTSVVDIKNKLVQLLGKEYEDSCNSDSTTIKAVGDLELRHCVFINKPADKNEIEIVKRIEDGTCYTIANFVLNLDDGIYQVNSCEDRLKDNIDWNAFGQLVTAGYEYLNKLKNGG